MPRTSNPQILTRWQERLTRYAATDQTVAQFCRCEGVSAPSFYRWKKRLASHAKIQPAQFVPLTLSMAQQQATTLTLPGGASLDLPSELSHARLTQVLAAVIEVTKNLETNRC
jgi:hypothetical protein